MADIKFIPGFHPTFRQQFDKLTRAYIADEVDPYQHCACFIGNLLNNNSGWSDCREGFNYDKNKVIGINKKDASTLRVLEVESNGLYTVRDICNIELVFLKTIYEETDGMCHGPLFEPALFVAFSKSLETLRQIHLKKGEIIDEVPSFAKRELKTP